MGARRIGISEARRLLPELVKTIASEGGRIDITYRGQPRVSLLRVSDVKDPKPTFAAGGLPRALEVELRVPAEDLVEVIRELRGRQGKARTRLLSSETRGGDKTLRPSRKQKSDRSR